MNLKDTLSYKKTLLILAFLSLLFGLVSAVFGELTLPFLIAPLAAIFVFEKGERRIFSIATSGGIIIINLLSFLLGFSASLFSIEGILCAFLLVLFYNRKFDKAESSFILTLIIALFFVINAILLAMMLIGSFDIDRAIDFYNQTIDSVRSVFANFAYDNYSEVFKAAGLDIAVSDFEEIFDRQMGLTVSYIVVLGFFVTGFSMKIFSSILFRLADDRERIVSWRFLTSNYYAYFYVILVFASIFTNSGAGIFALSVNNLYTVFMIVYLYVGASIAISLLAKKFRPVIAILITFGAILLLGSFAVHLLAMIGVLFTIRKNNELKMQTRQ